MAIPGFPSNSYDWSGPEVGAALAGLIVRDMVGAPRPGVLPSRADLVRGRTDWSYDVSPFVAVRVTDRQVLLGASVDLEAVPTSPAPASNARIDVVYSRPADVDAAEPVEAVFVAQGLPGAVPVKPAIPAGAIELATFLVSAGTIHTAAATRTLTFRTTVCAGGVIPFRSTAERDEFLAVPGQLALVGDVLYQRTATGWYRPGHVPDGARRESGSREFHRHADGDMAGRHVRGRSAGGCGDTAQRQPGRGGDGERTHVDGLQGPFP